MSRDSLHLLNCFRFGGAANSNVIKGVGMIAKIISDRSGVIWWVKRPNQFQSVWFMASKTFLFGTNLTGRNLNEILHEGNKRLTKFLMTLSYAIVVCCCTLNKTWNCDVYLFDKLAQTQVVINWRDTVAPSVHQWRFRLPRFWRLIFDYVMSYNSLTTSIAPSRMFIHKTKYTSYIATCYINSAFLK